jgi:hypothetical protein
VSCISSVPVMVRTDPPTATSGRNAGRPVRKPSSSERRTSAPPVTMLVLARNPTTPAISSPKAKPLRNLSEYVCRMPSGSSLTTENWLLLESRGPWVPSFQYSALLSILV